MRNEQFLKSHPLWQKALSIVLSLLLVLQLAGPLLPVAEAATDYNYTVVADDSTMYTWAGANYTQTSRNVGRVWTDKSVLTDDIILSSAIGQGTGDTITKTPGAEFMVALSALSSTSTMTTQTSVPLDIVLVLDTSGSMDETLVEEKSHYEYEPVYSVSNYQTYYILDGSTYRSVSYSSGVFGGQVGWRWRSSYFSDWNYVTPKTSASSSGTQFYTRTQVVDVEGFTKLEATQNAVNSFIQAADTLNAQILNENMKHRIGLVKFSGDVNNSVGNSSGATQVVSNLTTALTDASTASGTSLTDRVDALVANGATRAASGMSLANSVFANSAARPAGSNARRVVILFTDGEPNQHRDFWPSEAAQTVELAGEMKDAGIQVYSVAVFSEARTTDLPGNTNQAQTDKNFNYYMQGVSSNFPGASATYTGGNYATSSWSLILGNRAESGDYYKVAADADQLNNIFTNIFEDITSDLVSPTLVEDGHFAIGSGYVTFTDQLGPFMELKGFNGLTYSGSKVGTIPTVTAGATSYTFTGTIESPNPLVDTDTVDLSNILITVTPGTATTGQTITVKIPAGMLPLRYYDVEENPGEDEDYLTITDEYPVRLFYSVGLREDVKAAMASGRHESVDGLGEYVKKHTDAGGKTHFYSNFFEKLDSPADQRYATSEFVPALSNNFYYYVDDTVLYKLEGGSYVPLTAHPADGDTVYYHHTYYHTNGTHTDYISFVYDREASPVDLIKQDATTGNWYISAGTPKISLSNMAQFRQEKESGNKTGTSAYALYPTWDTVPGTAGRLDSINYLGNNGRMTYDATGALQISKEVTVPQDGGITAPNLTFSFRVEGLSGTYNVTRASATGSVNGTVTLTGDDTVTLRSGENLTFYGLAHGTDYTVTEVNLADGFRQTAPAGAVTGAIVAGETAQADFTNHYEVQPTGIASGWPQVVKRVYDDTPSLIPVGDWHDDWSFTFALWPAHEIHDPMPAGVSEMKLTLDRSSTAGTGNFAGAVMGGFDMSGIVFEKPGVYTYYVSEVEGTAAGMNYTAAQYKLEITVTDNGQGQLEAESAMYIYMDDFGALLQESTAEEYAVFHNLYSMDSNSLDLDVYKDYDDLSGGNHREDFVIQVTGSTGAPLPVRGTPVAGKHAVTATVSGSDLVPLGIITFTGADVGKTYTYTVQEIAGTCAGMTYDPSVYVATVQVGSQQVSATESAVTVDVTWTKDGQPYTPSEGQPTYFHNVYDPADATANLSVEKTLTGRGWQTGDSFVYDLTAVSGAPLPTATALALSDGSAGVGSVRTGAFGQITYDTVGTYVYHIRERVGSIPGVTYDPAVITATVTVTDGGNGALVASVAYSGDKADVAAFENVYEAAPVSTDGILSVTKSLTGRGWLAGDSFQFRLLADGSTPMPGATNATIRTENTTVAFDSGTGPITYDEAGTYTYYVVEVPGTVGGVTYDRAVWKATVTVTDDLAGKLQVSSVTWAKDTLAAGAEQTLANVAALSYTAQPNATKATFTNSYEAADTAPIQLGGTKRLLGRDMQAGERFQFLLEKVGSASGVIMPGQTTAVMTDAAEGDTAFLFEGIVFTEPGTYQFRIMEYTGNIYRMHYSDNVATVTVAVTDPGTGKLVAEITDVTSYLRNTNPQEDGTGLVFINHYYAPNESKDVLHTDGSVDSIAGQLVGVGDQILYTIHWENTSDQEADLLIVDTIPAGTEYVTDSAEPSATFNGSSLTWNIADVPAHGSVDVSFRVKVLPIAGGATVSNTALINNAYWTNIVQVEVPGKEAANQTAIQAGRDTVRVGDVIRYTIDYKNTATEAATITVTDMLPEGLTYVGTVSSHTCTVDGNELTWVIPNVAVNEAGTVIFEARVNEKALGGAIVNEATVLNHLTNVTVTTNPSQLPAPETASLTVSKSVVGAGAPNEQFTFHLMLKDAQGRLLTGAYPYTTSAGVSGSIISCDGDHNSSGVGSGSHGILKMGAGGWYTITGLPVGATYEVVETDIPAGFRQTGPAATGGTLAVGSNTYTVENTFTPVTVTIPVTKQVLDGTEAEKPAMRWHDDWLFRFELLAAPGAPLPAQQTVVLTDDDGGQINGANNYTASGAFPAITFTQPGTYTYVVAEDLKFDAAVPREPGVTYSQAEWVVTVTVAPDANNALQASYTVAQRMLDDGRNTTGTAEENGAALFCNTYELAKDTFIPIVYKQLNNPVPGGNTSPAGYVFGISALRGYLTTDPTQQAMNIPFYPGVLEVATGPAGYAAFRGLEFDSGEVGYTYEYMVYERERSDVPADAGYLQYDPNRYIIKVAVGTKLTGDGTDEATALTVTYHKAKQVGNDWVIDTDAGQLPNVTFTNTYTPAAAQLALKVQKDLQGRPWQTSDSFAFTMTPARPGVDPMPAGSTGVETVTVTEGHKSAGYVTAFPAITFDKVGEYGYFLREVKPAEAIPGVTYDENLYLAWVKVTDPGVGETGAGQLQAEVTYYLSNEEHQAVSPITTEQPVFVNTYSAASISLGDIPVEKIFDGRPWKQSDTFYFTIEPLNQMSGPVHPMPLNPTVSVVYGDEHTEQGGDPNKTLTRIHFGEIVFTQPGVYTYRVYERPGTIPGVSYDSAVYTIAVTVTDPGNGQLAVTGSVKKDGVDYNASALTFTNTYAPNSAQQNLYVQKELVGREWTDSDAFSFLLTPADPANPMPLVAGSSAVLDTLSIVKADAGHMDGWSITYTEPGVYVYTITEQIPATPEEGMTYDGHTATVTVTVTDPEQNGQLVTAVSYDDPGHSPVENTTAARFTNLVSEPKKEVVGSSGNSVDGKYVSAGEELTYTIHWAAMAEPGQASVNGPVTVTVKDMLPLGLVAVDGSTVISGAPATVPGKVMENGRQVLTWTLRNLPMGSSGTITFKALVTNTDTDGAVLENVASVNNHITNTTVSYLPGKSVSAVEQGDDLVTLKLGQKVQFTITYYHPGAGETVTVTDALSGNLDFVSAESGGVYEPAAHTVTWTDVSQAGDAAAWKTVTFVATLNKGALLDVTTNTAQVKHEYTVTTNPVEIDRVKVNDLAVSKTVEVAEGLTLTDAKKAQTFSFEVTLADQTGAPITGTYGYTVNGVDAGTVTPDAAGKVSLTLKHGETGLISGLPVGTVWTVKETNLPGGYTSNFTGDSISGVITATQVAQAGFVNTYSASPVEVVLTADKELTGPNGTDLSKHNPFQFGLFTGRADPTPIQTARSDNANGGAVTFRLNLDRPGEYRYLIREITDGSTRYTYDTTDYVAVITVTDGENGTLSHTVAYHVLEGGAVNDVVFTNQFHPEAKDLTADINAGKVVTGTHKPTDWEKAPENRFSFGLYNAAGDLVGTANNDETGKVEFLNALIVPAAGDVVVPAEAVGDYVFTMKELIPADPAAKHPAITYDAGVYTVVVTVVLDPDTQELKVADTDGIRYYDGTEDYLNRSPIHADEVVFTNTYDPVDTEPVTVTASKVLVGRTMATEDVFTFRLTDGNGNVIDEAVCDAQGQIRLDLGSYDAPGTYTYTLSEVEGDDKQIIYDETTYTVTVTVADVGGKLQATVTNDAAGGAPVFTNYFTKPTSLVLTAQKELTGKTLQEGEFDFVILDAAGNLLASGENKADKSITFEALTFDTVGEYTVYMAEVDADVAGYEYDSAKHPIVVKVTATGTDYALEAAVVSPTETVVFHNSYTPEPVGVVLEAKKVLSGRDLKEGEFQFYVTDRNGNQVAKGRNDAAGKVVFEEITFTQAGTYTYTVGEKKGALAGVTYDKTTYTVTVKVSQLPDGGLVAQVTGPEGGMTFTNSWAASPDTGDDFPVELWAGALLVSLGGITAVLAIGHHRRKSKREEQ